MTLKLITAPTAEPISLTEAKAHLRVDTSDDDTLIGSLITAARESVEVITRRALITQTWESVLDCWPNNKMDIPLPPLQSITSVKYKLSDGTETTWASSNYIVNVDCVPGRLTLSYGISWPSETLYPDGAIRVRFVAGYGATGSTVKQELRQAMLLMIGNWYENREAAGAHMQEIPFGANALLWHHRVFSF